MTIQFADVNGDGKADVCGRGIDGILCALSTGSSFGPVTPWTRSFSDGSGYYGQAGHPYYSTIQFEDLDGDGKADVCGRGEAGLYCRISTGSAFGPVTLWTTFFSDWTGGNWQYPSEWTSIYSYSSIKLGRTPPGSSGAVTLVCGRESTGLYCSESTGTAFWPAYLTGSTVFNNAHDLDYGQYPPYTAYARTLHWVPFFGYCGRLPDGIYCAELRR